MRSNTFLPLAFLTLLVTAGAAPVPMNPPTSSKVGAVSTSIGRSTSASAYVTKHRDTTDPIKAVKATAGKWRSSYFNEVGDSHRQVKPTKGKEEQKGPPKRYYKAIVSSDEEASQFAGNKKAKSTRSKEDFRPVTSLGPSSSSSSSSSGEDHIKQYSHRRLQALGPVKQRQKVNKPANEKNKVTQSKGEFSRVTSLEHDTTSSSSSSGEDHIKPLSLRRAQALALVKQKKNEQQVPMEKKPAKHSRSWYSEVMGSSGTDS
jgi:hypothetical protein